MSHISWKWGQRKSEAFFLTLPLPNEILYTSCIIVDSLVTYFTDFKEKITKCFLTRGAGMWILKGDECQRIQIQFSKCNCITVPFMTFAHQSCISALLAKSFCHEDGGLIQRWMSYWHERKHSLFLCIKTHLCCFLQMTNPAIQNDFSYYRRTLSRMRINNVPVSRSCPFALWVVWTLQLKKIKVV